MWADKVCEVVWSVLTMLLARSRSASDIYALRFFIGKGVYFVQREPWDGTNGLREKAWQKAAFTPACSTSLGRGIAKTSLQSGHVFSTLAVR